MDCERKAKEAPEGGGPESWEISERAITEFSDMLIRKGFRGAFFIHPETARRHAHLFLELKDRGFELGMHLHPGNFRDHSFKRCLGSYGFDEQRHILSLAVDDWKEALGYKPDSFRSGFFSANDHTFRILYELGFKQSSTSKPGRDLPELYASWVGAYPYPHHVNHDDRLAVGRSEPYEVPVSVNPQRLREHRDPLDLRVEERCMLKQHKETIDFNIRRMKELNVNPKVILSVTHNTEYFLSNKSVLEFIMDYINEATARHRMNPIPITLQELHNEVHKLI